MIVLLYGPNTMAIRRRLQELKDEADGGSGMLATNYTTVDGRDAKSADIIGPAMSPPFLAPKRLVVVENLIERYQGTGGRGAGAGRSLDPLAPLFEALEGGLPETTILVFLMPGAAGRNALMDRLKQIPGTSNELQPELKGEGLLRYIRQEASARGIKFHQGAPRKPHPGSEEWLRGATNDPAALLATLTRGDTLAIANELDKLALFAMGAPIGVDEIYELCAGDREAGQFALQDALLDGRLKDAMETFYLLRTEPNYNGQVMIGQLLSIYRRLAPGMDVLAEDGTPDAFATAMRIPSEQTWRRDRDLKRARRLGPAGLRRAIAAIVEADRSHKSGEVDEEIAMELLIGRLAGVP